jgi:serine/threonine-protein phosphatase 2B catalytic subunit
LTDYFTFKEEIEHKYTLDVYDKLMTAFDGLPLSALVNDEFLCIHGGISPAIRTIEDIRNVKRFVEPPQSGVMCDLLWADPMEEYDESPDELFRYNDVRSCSYVFSYRAAKNFLQRNNLRCIIRAHEAQDEGYRMYKAFEGFPTVITLFSAPNYLDAYGNKGAIMHFDGQVMNIRQFEWSDHPYWLPHFMDVFTWSLPFVAEKVAHMIYRILEIIGEDEDHEMAEQEELAKSAPSLAAKKRREALRAKILSVAKMRARLQGMRVESEHALHTGSDGFTETPSEELKDFGKIRARDRVNEARPPSPTTRRRSSSSSSSSSAATSDD